MSPTLGFDLARWCRLLRLPEGAAQGRWQSLRGPDNQREPQVGGPRSQALFGVFGGFRVLCSYIKAPAAFNGRPDPSNRHPGKALNQSNWSLWVGAQDPNPPEDSEQTGLGRFAVDVAYFITRAIFRSPSDRR